MITIKNWVEADLKKDDIIDVVDPLEPDRNGTYKVIEVKESEISVIKIAD